MKILTKEEVTQLFNVTIKNRNAHCNGCGKIIFVVDNNTNSTTLTNYVKGKYKYCPKCGHRINK